MSFVEIFFPNVHDEVKQYDELLSDNLVMIKSLRFLQLETVFVAWGQLEY
jgi:hypothetical protein